MIAMSAKKEKFNTEKFESLILYIAERCSGFPQFGKTVFYKLLYFSDFDFYEMKEKLLTGELYRKIDCGPAPTHFKETVEKLIKEKRLQKVRSEYHGFPQEKFFPLDKPNLSLFDGEEIKIIDSVIDKLGHLDANQISDYSHNDVPYQATKEKDIIDYELVFYRSPRYSVNLPQETYVNKI